jgi:hypothetical protein
VEIGVHLKTGLERRKTRQVQPSQISDMTNLAYTLVDSPAGPKRSGSIERSPSNDRTRWQASICPVEVMYRFNDAGKRGCDSVCIRISWVQNIWPYSSSEIIIRSDRIAKIDVERACDSWDWDTQG